MVPHAALLWHPDAGVSKRAAAAGGGGFRLDPLHDLAAHRSPEQDLPGQGDLGEGARLQQDALACDSSVTLVDCGCEPFGEADERCIPWLA